MASINLTGYRRARVRVTHPDMPMIGGIDEARFLAAYLAELRHFAALAPERRVSSLFFGGGTPSLMRPNTVAAILDAVDRVKNPA